MGSKKRALRVFRKSAIATAREIATAGHYPLPVERRSKSTHLEGWPELRIAIDQVERHFQPDSNVGILTGVTGLMDVDLDCEETLALADDYLPATGWEWGRNSTPRSHRLYHGTGEIPQPEKLKDPTRKNQDGETLIEFRAHRQQTLYPGSVHPSGERVRWYEHDLPAEIEPPKLLRCVKRLAAAALLARNWDTGSRDEIAAALIGVLDRRGWPAADVETFLVPILQLVEDEEHRDRLSKIIRTPRAREAGKHIFGFPTLREKLGPEVVRAISAWLELDDREATHQSGLPIALRSAYEIVNEPVEPSWLLRPYLEEYAIAVLTGDYATFKSFLALDWACHLALGKNWHSDPRSEKLERCAVVYISAEGRGLRKRLRAWVAQHYPNQPAEETLRSMSLYAIEAAVNLSDRDRIAALCAAIDTLAITPCLIVLDTLSRNSTAVEESNSTMAAFLNTIDAELRQRYRCTLLLIHHPGHENKARARGPSNLIGNTDASFILVREGKSYHVTLITERLKDSDAPKPIVLEAKEIELGVDRDGQRETSLVIASASGVLPTSITKRLGKNQGALLKVLKTDAAKRNGEGGTDAEISSLAKTAGLDPARKREAFEGLVNLGHLVRKDGVWLLAA